MSNSVSRVCVALILILGGAMSLAVAKDLPKTSHDGLELQENTKLRAVYLKPGATLAQYDRVAILDCYVAFAKHWERDYNDDAVGFEDRVSKKDMENIKKRVAAEFKKIFIKELEEKGYEVVTMGAEDVLVVRPSIMNLEVTAPDLMTPGMSSNFVASAGQMTLYMELYDSVTSDIIARIIDPEAGRGLGGMGFRANRVTNTQEEDQILRRWADALRSHLGDVQTATKSGS